MKCAVEEKKIRIRRKNIIRMVSGWQRNEIATFCKYLERGLKKKKKRKKGGAV